MNTLEIKHNKTGEIVPIEKWVWAVVYKDGTELHQYDIHTKLFHSITEVDLGNVEMLTMYCTYDNENMEKRLDLIVPEGAKIFHFYRQTVLEHGTENETKFTIYVFGYKRDGKAHYNYILPNDKVVQSGEDLADIIKFI
jgi:hypothetical protein